MVPSQAPAKQKQDLGELEAHRANEKGPRAVTQLTRLCDSETEGHMKTGRGGHQRLARDDTRINV